MSKKEDLKKIATGISGFDIISQGGLPQGRTTMISGTSGSAKTIFATEFLLRGINEFKENGVFVTFEEFPSDIKRNVKGFGWDIETLEKAGKWAFVDATPEPEDEVIEVGSYDLGALLARITYAVKKTGAQRVALDSIGGIFSQISDTQLIRKELFRIAMALKKLGVTSIMTAERTEEYGNVSRFGIEEFVADNVVILRNVLEGEKRRRTMEILKFRGTTHFKGEYPFSVVPGEGIICIPLASIELKQESSTVRIPSGIPDLDTMCSGGFFRDSITLISGATGCGKTCLSTQFVAGGIANGERCLLLAFEESREQLLRNARGWGVDYQQMEKDGKLRVICKYPEEASMEDHLIIIRREILEFKPNRINLDSLSALERVSTIKGFRDFVIGLTSFIKQQQIAGLFTSTTASLMGGTSVTEAHISTITDSIILLRYVEMFGEMRRSISVLKMRGSQHDKDIREYTIDGTGMHIGAPFRTVTGILGGVPKLITSEEADRMGELFK